LVEGGAVEVEHAGEGFDVERPSPETLDPPPKGLLPGRRLGVELSADRSSGRIEGQVLVGTASGQARAPPMLR
jgi:hypothetical protein